jgi:hypothetical protein
MTSAVEVLMGVSSFLGLGFMFITNNPDTPALQLLHNKSYATTQIGLRIPSGFQPPVPLCFATMFETVKTGIATTTGKLAHLRRLL